MSALEYEGRHRSPNPISTPADFLLNTDEVAIVVDAAAKAVAAAQKAVEDLNFLYELGASS